MVKLPKSLVVGYGSIGRRHKEILKKLGAPTAVVSHHASDLDCPCFTTLVEGLHAFSPDYIVIANRTSEHLKTLDQLQANGFKGICLVEKPLTDSAVFPERIYSFEIYAGYVLRFHPLIQKAKHLLEGKTLLSIQAYVGQYLPDWRPGADYRDCYSAKKDEGGGVIRDLSHELDYLQNFAGQWNRVAAIGGHFSNLEIDSDDVFGLLMQTDGCPLVQCQLNYLDRNVRRDCTIQYEGGTVYFDFIMNLLVHNGVEENFELERNDMFSAMHTAAWNRQSNELCSLHEALQTLELIDAAEQAAEGLNWICRINR